MSKTDYLKIEGTQIIKQWSLFSRKNCDIWIKYFEISRLNTRHGNHALFRHNN